MQKEFKSLSEEREELSRYLREQGLSVNVCGDILRVVINQDKEFIRRVKEILEDMPTIPEYIKRLDKLIGPKLITK